MPDVWHALSGTGTIPGFAIGLRCLHQQRPLANLLWAGMTLIRDGGHYAGGTMPHWPDGANGAGVLLTESKMNRKVRQGHKVFELNTLCVLRG